MIPNRRLLRHLVLLELALALLFAGVSVYVFVQHPDSLQLQIMLAFIGLAGLLNGLFLVRKLRESRQRPRSRQARPNGSGPSGSGTPVKSKNGSKKPKR